MTFVSGRDLGDEWDRALYVEAMYQELVAQYSVVGTCRLLGRELKRRAAAGEPFTEQELSEVDDTEIEITAMEVADAAGRGRA